MSSSLLSSQLRHSFLCGLHIVVVRGLVCFNETWAMSAGVINPGRSNKVEKVTVEIHDQRSTSYFRFCLLLYLFLPSCALFLFLQLLFEYSSFGLCRNMTFVCRRDVKHNFLLLSLPNPLPSKSSLTLRKFCGEWFLDRPPRRHNAHSMSFHFHSSHSYSHKLGTRLASCTN
jgi:hypothetical protein